MPVRETLTIRLTPEVKDQLGCFADPTRRTKSFLAAEAIADYVARESQTISGIASGLADMNAERLVPHDAAMRRLETTIATATRKKR
ncbi:MAG TPA: CopG family transcriptional regulator [Acetobacteraceae bacterium]|nr:CopG family transcriptional regulator [Acetobacteraceae bacterium]